MFTVKSRLCCAHRRYSCSTRKRIERYNVAKSKHSVISARNHNTSVGRRLPTWIILPYNCIRGMTERQPHNGEKATIPSLQLKRWDQPTWGAWTPGWSDHIVGQALTAPESVLWASLITSTWKLATTWPRPRCLELALRLCFLDLFKNLGDSVSPIVESTVGTM